MGWFSGIQLKALLLIGGLALLGIGGVYAYHLVATSELHKVIKDKDEVIAKQVQEIETYRLANENLKAANKRIQEDLEETKAMLEKAQKLIEDYYANIAEVENEVRESRPDRERREDEGKAEEVLDEDIAQMKCQNAHFGDPSGRCVKGVWATN
jgi:cell division protein FtsB